MQRLYLKGGNYDKPILFFGYNMNLRITYNDNTTKILIYKIKFSSMYKFKVFVLQYKTKISTGVTSKAFSD